ncbi:hypothetical protein [Aeromonas salmonicida]|uniref:hypothetical protein n=1 Tax=Aeromonas salmonicida TaxID=645 RepID=UPI00232BD2D2|nr:hypothetical protein [Aeromonas salmonicida]WCH25167.1 hypothetical protein ONZ54_23155 [Aeromonas salmonicida]
MTAIELLAAVQKRFSMLLVGEPQQHQLLIDAMGQYQDLAGVTKTVRLPEIKDYSAPPDYLAPIVGSDAEGNYAPVETFTDEDGKEILTPDPRAIPPVRFTYLVNLRNIDLKTYQIPHTAVGMIQDYLEVLIAIPNDERTARIQEAGKLDTSRLPTPADREAQLVSLREAMKSQRAILPMITIQPY